MEEKHQLVENSSQILSLPKDMLRIIFLFLNYESSLNFRLVCKLFESISSDLFVEKIRKLTKLACGFDTSYLLRANGALYAWGYNTTGLCLTNNVINYPPKKVLPRNNMGNITLPLTNNAHYKPQRVLTTNNVTNIVAGDWHSLFVEETNLYSWGGNGSNQLGIGHNNKCPTKQLLSDLEDTVILAAGGAHSFALNRTNTFYTWGSNDSGELGLDHTNTVKIPIQVSWLIKIVSISAGKEYSLGLTNGGIVYSWGNNDFGQLGLGDERPRYAPVEIPNLKNVVEISASSHSLARTLEGIVYSWGWNSFGELGLGDTKNRNTPELIPNLKDVVGISAGNFFSVALIKGGTLKSWGNNSYGQLGLGHNTNCHTPTELDSLDNIVIFATGGAHCLALTENYMLYSWGNNKEGQLGLGDNQDRNLPHPVLQLPIYKIEESMERRRYKRQEQMQLDYFMIKKQDLLERLETYISAARTTQYALSKTTSLTFFPMGDDNLVSKLKLSLSLKNTVNEMENDIEACRRLLRKDQNFDENLDDCLTEMIEMLSNPKKPIQSHSSFTN